MRGWFRTMMHLTTFACPSSSRLLPPLAVKSVCLSLADVTCVSFSKGQRFSFHGLTCSPLPAPSFPIGQLFLSNTFTAIVLNTWTLSSQYSVYTKFFHVSQTRLCSNNPSLQSASVNLDLPPRGFEDQSPRRSSDETSAFARSPGPRSPHALPPVAASPGVHTIPADSLVTDSTNQEDESSISGANDYVTCQRGGGLIHRTALVHPSTRVEVGAVVQAGATVAENSEIGTGSVIGVNVTLGANCKLWNNVVLHNCVVGERCIFHSGVCVGQDGFGFFVNDKGEMVKKAQTLGVRIGSDVEIGANSCIDRGSWRDTVIGDHCKLDNHVQVGHNVVMGCCCLLCGQVGIAGSVTLGDYVVLAGQSGVCDHVNITSKVRIGAKSGVTADITEPGDYVGFPAVPAKEWKRAVVLGRRAARGPKQAGTKGKQDEAEEREEGGNHSSESTSEGFCNQG
eukprot:TRINITY_DN10319_c0_g1_i1.p1 TRINITY_DN10319_c0_g1~~TRINITY_DN10319_c0_g1_i1.p1  ORF type:complete len:452 (-),score=38.72 TRINITY_DN10319_c0_g1_i1:181-1536(-)